MTRRLGAGRPRAGARGMRARDALGLGVSVLTAFALVGFTPLAFAAAKATGANSTLAIPGSTLRLGMRLTRVDSLAAFRMGARSAGPNQRNGPTRFFGINAVTTLNFEAGRMTHAHFEIHDVSTHARDYVEDQLRRSGLKPACDLWDDEHHQCDWNGACNLRVVWAPGTMNVDATPPASWSFADTSAAAPTPASTAAAAMAMPSTAAQGGGSSAPVLSLTGSTPTVTHSGAVPMSGIAAAALGGTDALPLIADTLFIGWPHDVSVAHRGRTEIPPSDPVYPDAARSAGVQGVVRLIATVDSRGRVSKTELVHSIPELDRAAIDAVTACRFVPLGPPGTPQGFRVLVQVRFTR